MRTIDADELSREIIKSPVTDFFTYQNGQTVWSQTILRFIGEQSTVEAIPVEQVARIIDMATDVPPCRYAYPDNIDWCKSRNCKNGKADFYECWLHALREGWLDE